MARTKKALSTDTAPKKTVGKSKRRTASVDYDAAAPVATFGPRDAPLARKKPIPVSKRAGLVMPCSRVLRSMRDGNYAAHIQRGKFSVT